MNQQPEHVPVPGPQEGDPQWLAGRKYQPGVVPWIGASQAAAACNESSYATALDVYLQAHGQEREFSEAATTRMRRGRKLQPLIIEEAAIEMGVEAQENNRLWIHPQHEFMVATPDAFVLLSPTELMEVKAAGPHMYSAIPSDTKYGQDGTDWVPNDVMFQAQQQMSVMGCRKCFVVALFGVYTLRIYEIDRNDELIACIIDAEQELVERIINHDPPTPDWSHERTRALVRELRGYQPNTVVQLGEAHRDMWRERQQVAEQIKQLEQRKEALTNQLLWDMQGCEIGRLPDCGKELRRSVIKDTLWTEADVEEVRAKIGQVKRKGHERLLERKCR